MVAATAEINSEVQIGIDQSIPLVLVMPEMDSDLLVRTRAARFIGAVATDSLLENTVLVEKPIESLHDAIHRAEVGEAEAYRLIEINVSTEAIEQTIKAGHVGRKVPLVIAPDGKITQHNQTYDSVQANSLRVMNGHPIMQPRTEAETRNGFRLEDVIRQGYFDNDYSFVVFSRAEDLPDIFFTDTMSCSIQVTTKYEDGLATETAFVAGVKEAGDKPHDEETVVKVFANLGIDVSGLTPAEIIDTPLLIHNSLIPNGAIDLVAMFDESAGGTFFGENKPQQNYLDYLNKCHEREEMLQPKVHDIVQDLIDEAPTIKSPLKAIQRLHKLTEKHMVEQAVFDLEINPNVFGPTSASHVQEARLQFELGNNQAGLNETTKAIETADSRSCPSVFNSSEDPLSLNESAESEVDQYGPLTFKCPNGHTNTRPRNKLIEKCTTCNTDVRC